ncbi:hypothetical protein VOLCADRAFT_87742 [Volvox carteri f. nagariensis]|uniref:Uncharacterized protein n=1 Tax=Volvox carteri f. nagariensis TaxID=3068 RepID=D8TM46_VOLCA|nr:uncharacterized protein VOLCADRAFT_87742 [Volvox carteri f. nagariensis]EFJ51579.1 hypothetical protein VOLCADRAFT_87742 [Volvox carteri f. nagariensis]|eukprot:XP_002947531.1 hypothetical protein VOLCADRAFT_87742 [Volvox carteri f. nagariensis]
MAAAVAEEAEVTESTALTGSMSETGTKLALDGVETLGATGAVTATSADALSLDLDLKLDLPATGNLGFMGEEELPSAGDLRALLHRAQSMATALAVRHPHVANLEKLARRIRSDLEFVQRCCPPSGGNNGDGDGGRGGDVVRPLALTPCRVQGIINNLRGFKGELLAAQTAPGVVGVLRRFQARVVLPPEAAPPSSTAATRPADGPQGGDRSDGIVCAVAAAVGQKRLLADVAGGSPGGGGGRGEGRREEVLAAEGPSAAATSAAAETEEGHCWIEVKNQEMFGLESVHWTGAARHVKGLRRQLEELLAVAAAPQHARRWRAPRVVLFFPSGVHRNVRQQLEARGAYVAVGPDVTTMCGLVSEVSHQAGITDGVTDPALEQWAQRTVHWRDCLAAEKSSPLMTELAPWLAPGRELLAAELACRQFQVLVDMFAERLGVVLEAVVHRPVWLTGK